MQIMFVAALLFWSSRGISQIVTVPQIPEGRTALAIFGQEVLEETVTKTKAPGLLSEAKQKLAEAINRTAVYEWKNLYKSDDVLADELVTDKMLGMKIVGLTSVWLPQSNTVSVMKFEGIIAAIEAVDNFMVPGDSSKRVVRGIKVKFSDPSTPLKDLLLPFRTRNSAFLDAGLERLFYLRYYGLYVAGRKLQ